MANKLTQSRTDACSCKENTSVLQNKSSPIKYVNEEVRVSLQNAPVPSEFKQVLEGVISDPQLSPISLMSSVNTGVWDSSDVTVSEMAIAPQPIEPIARLVKKMRPLVLTDTMVGLAGLEYPVPWCGGCGEGFVLSELTLDLHGVQHITPGIAALNGLSLAGLVTNCYGLFFGGEELIEGLRTECGLKAKSVSPELCPPAIQATEGKVSVPKLRKMKNELIKLYNNLLDKINEAKNALKAAERKNQGTDTGQAAIQRAKQNLAALEKLRDDLKNEVDRIAKKKSPKKETKAKEKESRKIRGAGQTRLANKACLFWVDETYQDAKTKTQRNCYILKFIRVVPMALITVNPKQVLYIERGSGEERITEASYKRKVAKSAKEGKEEEEKERWLRAEPYSIEVHEREHTKHYQQWLTKKLKGQTFTGVAIDQNDIKNENKRIRRQLEDVLTEALYEYTYADRKTYPHGFSETAAIKAQRAVLINQEKVGKEAAEKAFDAQKKAEEKKWKDELAKKKAAEEKWKRAPFPPKPKEHCLNAVEKEFVEMKEKQNKKDKVFFFGVS